MQKPLYRRVARRLGSLFATARHSAGRVVAGGPRRFYGQWQPPLDAVIWHRYFFNWRSPGVCAECGAGDGVSESTCYTFERHLGWKAINIEAFARHYSALERNRPRAINIHAALSIDSASKTFRQAVHPVHGNNFGNGSVRHLQSHIDDLLQQGCRFEEVEVPGATWEAVCAQARLTTLDLFVLDVEGHELDILRTFNSRSILPSIFVIELWAENESEVTAILADLGYLDDGTYRNNRFFRLPSFSWDSPARERNKPL
jgi:FkbM family methyltransferase